MVLQKKHNLQKTFIKYARNYIKMKKLLIATDCFLPRWDGIARFLDSLLPYIQELYKITIIAPNFEGKFDEYPNVKVIRVPLHTHIHIGDYTPAKKSKSICKKIVAQQDIIWIQTIGPIGEIVSQYAHSLKKPYAVYVHSIDWQLVHRALSKYNIFAKPFGYIAKRIAKKVYNNASFVMVPSNEIKELLIWNSVKTSIHIVKLCIYTKKISPLLDKQKAKQEVGFLNDDRIITYVGRISREKDVLTLYRAFLRIHKEFENAKLCIIGKGISEYTSILEKNSKVRIISQTHNVEKYLQASDIYCLPSLLETTSLSTLEAMSCELPVVCTPVGLMKEYIIDKINGLHFPIANSLVLSLKLKTLLEDSIKAKNLGLQARKTVQREYEWRNTVNHIRKELARLSTLSNSQS